MANLEKEDRLLPLIILFQPHPSAGDKELLFLHTEGGTLSNKPHPSAGDKELLFLHTEGGDRGHSILVAVFRIHRIHMFLGLPDPDPYIIMQK